MDAEHDNFRNLAERIENAFIEIDSEICTDLRESDGGYIKMWREALDLQEKFPVISAVTEGGGELRLSAEEHKALARYLSLKHSMENVERKQIYFRGHTDNFAYMKKIGAV